MEDICIRFFCDRSCVSPLPSHTLALCSVLWLADETTQKIRSVEYVCSHIGRLAGGPSGDMSSQVFT